MAGFAARVIRRVDKKSSRIANLILPLASTATAGMPRVRATVLSALLMSSASPVSRAYGSTLPHREANGMTLGTLLDAAMSTPAESTKKCPLNCEPPECSGERKTAPRRTPFHAQRREKPHHNDSECERRGKTSVTSRRSKSSAAKEASLRAFNIALHEKKVAKTLGRLCDL